MNAADGEYVSRRCISGNVLWPVSANPNLSRGIERGCYTREGSSVFARLMIRAIAAAISSRIATKCGDRQDVSDTISGHVKIVQSVRVEWHYGCRPLQFDMCHSGYCVIGYGPSVTAFQSDRSWNQPHKRHAR
jgi:hypothetical protein